MADQFVRRSADDYAQAFDGLHPIGPAWPRAEAPVPSDTSVRGDDEALSDLTRGLAKVWGDKVDARAADLLFLETDPRYTGELLAEWERAYGLPDPCVPVVQTLPERRQALVAKITTEGGQSRAFFIGVAASLGYSITITEYVPFQFGLSSFGGSRGRLNPPGMRYVWRVRVSGGRSTRFQFGASSFGRDSLLEIREAEDLECIFRRWKPAHTLMFFDYGDPAPVVTKDRFDFGTSTFGNDPLLRLTAA
ncbi:YmfQ family protein [Methylobacterium mesophilicum]